jgi:Zn-dependent alcohol dehydrogenase
MGYRVVASDIDDDKLRLATSGGAEHVVNAKSPNAVDEIRSVTNGGAHSALVTAVRYVHFNC